jgi:hypothetical protein
MQAPGSVRRAFRRESPGASATCHDTVLPQAPTGPRATARDRKPPAPAALWPRRENEVLPMATMTKLRKQIERMSALNGWRMRWHMQ